jgi:uncharacterized protein (TIGR02284 family)
MKDSEKIIEVLTDLIKINNDRIEGYEKAADNIDADETTLKTMFYQLSEESRENKDRLIEEVKSLGGDPEADETTNRGKIYRRWMDVRVTFSGNDTLSTLSSCEFGEDAAQRAYQDALDESRDFPASLQQLISRQQELLKMSHDLIRNQRDQYKNAVHH